MTGLRIGLLGVDANLDSPESGSWSAQQLSLSGYLAADSLEALLALREQLIAYDGVPDAVPVIADPDSRATGFYTVSQVTVDVPVGSMSNLVFPFAATLTRIASSSAPLVESRVLAALRVPVTGGSNQAGVTTSTMTPWHAVPDTAQGYRAPSGASVVTRAAESGAVRVYLSTGSSGGLVDASPSWQQDPAHFYDGAATLRSGQADDLEGASVATFGYSTSVQSYTVPAGVSSVRVVASGAQGGSTASGGLNRTGGAGATVAATIPVTAGDVLKVTVGGRGSVSGGGLFAGSAKGGAGGAGGGGGGAPTLVATSGGAALVVAAGGGGAATISQGGDGGYNGQAGYGGAGAGQGGTQTAGGAGGAGGGAAGGSPGSNKVAAGGAAFGSGTGGGGGGYYGGGGGSQSGTVGASSIGAGGGGSSYVASSAVASSYSDGAHLGDGEVSITAIPGSGGVNPPADITRYVVVGRQVIASPLGWELSNGLLRVRPSYDGTTATVEVAAFDGAAWRPKTWRLWDKAAGAAVTARARAISVLHNSPEEVRLRWIFDLPDELNTVTIDLRLRRGARMVEITTQGTTSLRWGWLLATAEAATTQTWGVYAAANDSYGGRYFITSADAVTSDSVQGGLARTAAGSGVTVGIGYTGNYSSAQAADQPQQLAYQFHAAGVETMAVVAQ